MASYVTPKKNTAFVFHVGLTDQANTKVLKSAPTLASGDVKVRTDDGAESNINTLPTASGTVVKVSLASTEMNGDNITVIFRDAAGAEWCDLMVSIQTTAQQIDDLATPTTVWAAATRTLTAISDSAGVTTLLSRIGGALTITSGKVDVNDKTGFALSAAGVQAVWDALTSALTAVGSIGKYLVDNVTGGSAPTAAAIRAEIDSNSTQLAAIKAKTDNLPADPADASDVAGAFSAVNSTLTGIDAVTDKLDTALELDGAVYRFTTNALEQGPTSGSAPTAAAVASAVRTELATELGRVDAAVSTRATPAQVNAEVLDVLATDTFAEPASVPAATSSLKDKLAWLFTLSRNKLTQTSDTQTVRNDADSGSIATATVSDDGTTFTRGEYS